MNKEEILENLCMYDKRNPFFYKDEWSWKKPRNNCFCDNCFYWRDKLAVELLKYDKTNIKK